MPDSTRMANARRIIAEIEAEMKRTGYWSTQPLPAEAYDFRQAFAMDTMTFPQWLQFVLIPRVRQIIDEQGAFPAHSMVGTQAIREFDGDENAAQLVALLNKFDHLFDGASPGLR